MNEKVLLRVWLAATMQFYDFWVPLELSVRDASTLIAKLLSVRESDFYVADSTSTLFDFDSGEQLAVTCAIGNLGFSDGKRLILI
ncbi:MAG: hypothetical protein LBG97_02355 [Coriobacteriales bacterium]|jgi:hypothetical protein|nr:hypothetical protein [Coriobacteriales bacterium]